MHFIKAGPMTAIEAVTQKLIEALTGGRQVLWLVAGGSNVHLEVEIMNNLHHLTDRQLSNLVILPMDERYGKFAHHNSNSQQLRTADFKPGTAHWVDILSQNSSLAKTIAFYSDTVSQAMVRAELIVGQFGLGNDGHIAGILPASPACLDTTVQVIGYQWSDFVRLTLTPLALSKVDIAYVMVYGTNKNQALHRLQAKLEPLDKLPASLLYNIPQVYVYNNIIESE